MDGDNMNCPVVIDESLPSCSDPLPAMYTRLA
jgi:hypothetical protein